MIHRSIAVACSLIALAAARPASAQQPLRAVALVESQSVYIGQPFVLSLRIEGTDTPQPVDLTQLRQDFEVTDGGGGAQNSQQLTIVNGQMTRVVRRGYVLRYQLTPKRQGTLTIPSLRVRDGDRQTTTDPVKVVVRPPAESEDFKLRMRLSEKQVYVGQPVVLTTTWYIGRNVDGFRLRMPVLEDPDFNVLDPRVRIDPARQSDYVDLALNDGQVTARKGRGTIDNVEYLTVSFEKVLAARKPGELRLEPSVAAFRALTRSRRRSRSLFEGFGFGDGFFGGRQTYEPMSIPSNAPTLKVLPLPQAGRPEPFSGLIGEFEFSVDASPTEVSVGDPITLTARISGPKFLDYVRLPPLAQQSALASGFQVPDAQAAGQVRGVEKVFTQTIRARSSTVTEIPALELNFFNPATGRYQTASSDPIPLTVRGARIVTAADAEGAGESVVVANEIGARREGIAHQYLDSDALEPQPAGLRERVASPLWVLLLAAPPGVFFGLLAWTATARRGSGGSRQAVRARKGLLAAVESAGEGYEARLLSALQSYLGALLERPAAALTYSDVGSGLAGRGVRGDALQDLRFVFESCEAARFGGGASANRSELARRARAALSGIEEVLR